MKANPPHPSRALAPSWPRRLLCPALVTLGLLSGSSPRAADVVWQDPVSGDFSDPQRWLIDGVPPQHRIPTSDDRILIATTPPIVVNVANSPTVASAHVGESVTLNLQSDLTVRGEFNGSPVIQGPGTLRAGFWTIGVGTAFATLVGARADLVGLSLPGSGFGLMIRSASQVLVANYRDTTLRGRRPIIVDGAGSDWTVFDTISEAPGLEVTVRNGATANLSTVDAVGAFLLESGATVNAVRFDPLHLSVRGGSQLITGDARPRGFGQSLGLGPAEVMASTWTIQGRLTLPGVFGTVLRLGEGGRIQATDLDLVDSARVEIGTAENPAPNDPSAGTLKVANRLRIQDGTLRIRNGTVECGELELHGDGAIQGEVGLDVYDGLINVSGRAIFDTRATVAALSLSAASGVIGPVAGGSGQIVGEDVLLNFGESLIIGGEGGGSLRLKGDFVRPVKARQFILGQSPTGRGAVEFTTSGGDWDIGDRMIVGDQGEGTLTLLGGAFTADSLALTIAQQPGSRGTVNLRGPDTSWLYLPFDSNQALVVGERGKGLLSIDGAALSAATVVIGRSTEDNQAIIVGPAPSLTATPANLNASRHLIVGDGGFGTLELAAAGEAQAALVTVGRQSVSTNRLAVSAGSSLTSFQGITVGDRGRGLLQSRGTVTTDRTIAVGQGDAADGSIEVLDPGGSLVSYRGGIVLARGAAAKASLSLRNGAHIDVQELATEATPTGRADVSLDGQGSELRVADTLRLGQIGRPTGPTLMGISGGAYAKVGRVLLVRRNASLVLGGGSMVVGAGPQPAPGFLRVFAGGNIIGDGRIQGDLVAEEGSRVRPGATVGALSITGKLDCRLGSTIEFDVAGPMAPDQHDFIHTTGALSIQGVVQIRFIDGYAPNAGERYCFTQADGGLAFTPSEVRITGLAPGFRFRMEADPLGTLCLVASSNANTDSAPILDASRSVATEEFVLHWTAPATWRLETSTQPSTGWTPVGATSSEGADHSHVVSSPDPARFFRLSRP